MTRSVTRLAKAAAVAGVCACCLVWAGCGDPQTASLDHMNRLALRVREYHAQHGRPPDGLAELKELFGSEDEYDGAMKNPLTGDDPGYLYVKPPAGVLESSLVYRVVMLYQLRDGQKAEDLPVGYAAGSTGPIEKGSITETVPAWKAFTSPEAGCKVTLPAEPASDTKDPSQVTLRAQFCGVQYGLVSSREPLLRVASRLSPQQILRLSRDAHAENVGARVAASRKIELEGRPGLASTLLATNRDSEFQVRWFLAGDRIICLNVSGPKGSLNDENAGRFFASLQLLDR